MFPSLLKAGICLFLLQCELITSYAQRTPPAPPTDNAQMLAIVVADQKDRGNNYFYEPGTPEPPPLSGLEIRKNDDSREDKVRDLLNVGSLHTATDYYRAALVFQHAYKPDDVLFAHVLATVAASRGSVDALWLAAATLDRYLVDTGKQQVFGTQFSPSPQSPNGSAWQQDPVSPLLSDALRAALCVTPLAAQTKGLPARLASTSLSPCPVAAALNPSSQAAGATKRLFNRAVKQ